MATKFNPFTGNFDITENAVTTVTTSTVGTVIDNSFASSSELSDYINTGSASFTFNSGGGLLVSGGSSNYSNYFTSSYVTLSKNYEMILEFTSTVAGAGIAIGFNNLHARIDTSSGANRGLVYIENDTSGTPSTIATSASALTFSDTTDTLRIVLRQDYLTVYLTVYNVTTPSNPPVTVVYTQTLTSGFPTLQFFSNPAIYAYDGTQIISKFQYTNIDYKNADLLIMGDSNTVGWYQGNNPFFRIIRSNFNGKVALQATPGITSAQLASASAETTAINAKYALINIGTNDALSGVILATYMANLATIITNLTNNGTIPIFCTVIPNSNSTANTLLQSYNSSIVSTYGGIYTIIDTNAEQSTGGTVNPTYNNGTHMTSAGGLNYAGVVLRTLASKRIQTDDPFSYPVKFGTTNMVDTTGANVMSYTGSPGAGAFNWNSKINNGSGTACFDFVNGASGSGEMLLRVFNQANNSTANKIAVKLGMFNSATAGNMNIYMWGGCGTVTAGSETTNWGIDNTIAGIRTTVLQILGNKTGIKAGLSTSFAKVGGTIFSHYTDAGTPATTTETDLYSDSVAANTLYENGDELKAQYSLILQSTGGTTKDVRIYFGGTVIWDSGTLSIASPTNLVIDVSIIRDSTISVRTVVTAQGNSTVTPNISSVTGLNFSNSNILKITGQSGAGAALNDIVAKTGIVKWQPSA